MNIPNWQLKSPINAIIFDCDGTLATIEGIDELAETQDIQERVKFLTHAAMTTTGININLYAERLKLIHPSRARILNLGQTYFDHCVDNVADVMQILQRLDKTIYIVSAGLYPAVQRFGQLLQIPAEHIFAVNVEFDAEGHYLDFDRTSPLVIKNGKRDIVNQLKQQHPELIYVGDGLSDYEVYDLVTRFVGFGGAFYRKNIAELCQYYITAASMAPLLPLILTQAEAQQLTASEKTIYQKGLHALRNKEVIIR
jgi:phosphoserine phosphatase